MSFSRNNTISKGGVSHKSNPLSYCHIDAEQGQHKYLERVGNFNGNSQNVLKWKKLKIVPDLSINTRLIWLTEFINPSSFTEQMVLFDSTNRKNSKELLKLQANNTV